jgi:hypothetical protein
MTLTDPRDALAEQSNFVSYLVGLAGLSRLVHELATDGDEGSARAGEADDFVHVLLGVASLGDAIERLGESTPMQQVSAQEPSAGSPTTRWLR